MLAPSRVTTRYDAVFGKNFSVRIEQRRLDLLEASDRSDVGEIWSEA